MCSFNDDDGWAYGDDDFTDYEDYLNGDNDEALEKVLDEVVIEDEEESGEPIDIDETEIDQSEEEVE